MPSPEPKKEVNLPGKKVNNSNSQKKITVTIDSDIEDVIRSSQAGDLLFFSDKPDLFLELEKDEVERLSRKDRQSYYMAYGAWKYNCENADPEPTEGIKISPRFASARARLEIQGGDPDKAYVWKRTDELMKAGHEGYTIARGSNLRTFGGGPKSKVHKLGVFGDDELVLMMEPKERQEERLRKVGEKSKKRIETFDEAAKEELNRGGIAYGDSGRESGRFTPTK